MNRKILTSVVLFMLGFAQTTRAGLFSFSGGDVGEGLDLDGTFIYAVRIADTDGSAPLLIRSATFTDDSATPGVTVTNFPAFLNQWSTPNYGASANDDNLESVMDSIRHANALPGTGNVDLAVIVGSTYKLQMMWHETTSNRGFDIFVEGVNEQDNFDTGPVNALPASGQGFVHQFVAGDTNLDIDLVGVSGEFDDTNPTIFAFTLELVPEPSTSALAGLAIAALAVVRRRHKSRDDRR